MRQTALARKTKGRVVLVALTLVIASCGGPDAEAREVLASVPTTTTPEPTSTTSPGTTVTTVPPAFKPTSTSAEPESDVKAGGIVLGEVELDMLESTVTLTAEEPWNVEIAMDGAVVLVDPDRVSEFTRGVMFLEAIPFAATIDEWADMHDGATIESRYETQVGGLDAVVYDITYAGEGDLAILTATCCGGSIVVRSIEYYRVWTIETGRDRPLALFAAVLTDDTDWLSKAEQLVATIEIAP